MPNIPEIKIGNTTYKLKDADLRDDVTILESAINESVVVKHLYKFFNISGTIIDKTSSAPSEIYAYMEMNTVGLNGNLLRLKGRDWQQGSTNNRRAGYTFFDINGNIVEQMAATNKEFDIVKRIPSGAVRLIVNGYESSEYGNFCSIEMLELPYTIVRDLQIYKSDGSVVDMTSYAASYGEYYSFIEKYFDAGENNYFHIEGFDRQIGTYSRAGYIFFDESDNVVEMQTSIQSGFSVNVHAPSTACKIIVNGVNSNVSSDEKNANSPIAELISQFDFLNVSESESKSQWNGKSIVWFGTSIPEGKVNGKSYPQMIGEALGATVYNEAIGSSEMSIYNTNNASRSKALSYTQTEKQAMDWWSSLSESEKTKGLAASRDVVFDKYLSTGSVGSVDLYVFDHGYNDYNSSSPDDYLTEPVNEYDRTYPMGAASFLINRILSDNPRAKIVWIGHYENALLDPLDHQSWGKPVAQFQEKICGKYGIPLLKLWEKTGWSNPNKVTTTGYWDGVTWITSGGISRQDYVKNCMFSDGIHPNTDGSGYSTQMLAIIIEEFLRSLK